MAKAIVGGHLLLGEPGQINGSWDPIPPTWSLIRFDVVDILYISPFSILKPDYIFGLEGGNKTNPTGVFASRFRWVVSQARYQNPKIKIIAMQFVGGNDYSILTSDDLIEKYTDSVRDFLAEWQDLKDPVTGTPLHLDGYDVDYEWTSDGDGNMQYWAPTVLSQIRSKLDALSQKTKSPRYQVSITPAGTKNLNGSLSTVLDYINMQNYDGGFSTGPDDYLSAIPGLKPIQLVWGVTSELPDKNKATSMTDAITQSKPLAGIWAWRLNSNVWPFENMAQVAIYNKVNGVISVLDLDDKVNDGWTKDAGRGPNGTLISPWTEQDWINAKEYRN